MTQEEKEILLKDLCTRIPYSQIVDIDGELKKLIAISNNFIHFTDLTDDDLDGIFDLDSCVVKPYLRSLSSITEEEKETYQMFFNEDGLLNTSVDTYLDWLLENHFDYRGLIHMGLALKAPNNMYKIE